MIICNEMGDMCPDYDRIMSDKRFKSVDAVREGRVYKIDADIVSRPGPRIVDAIETVHKYLKGVCGNRTKEKEEVSTASFELFIGVFAISFVSILRRMRRRCDKK